LHLLAGRPGDIAAEFEPHVNTLEVTNAPQLRRRLAVVPRFLRSFWTMFRAIGRLKRERDISLVYVNTVMFPQAIVGARLNGIRCVVHIHEVESKYPWLVYQTYVALATILAARIISVCEYIPAQRRIFFKKKMREKTRIVYNASAFDPGPVRRSPGAVIRLVTVGTLSPLKGTGDIPALALALAERLGKERFELVSVGSVHHPETFDRVTGTLRETGLDDRVTFAGEHSDIEPFYRDAHVYVHLAHSDVFPMVLVEAASFSLPVVTTDAGGCPEAVEDGKTGYVVPVGGCEAMADRVARLAADPALYDAMSAAAYARYKTRFTPDHAAGGIRAVLAELR
ncbi:MAG: glycosyltransferase family 4 protein, partial [bacterium]